MQERCAELLGRVQDEFDKQAQELCRLRVYVSHLEDDNWNLAQQNSALEQRNERLVDVLKIIATHIDLACPLSPGVYKLLAAMGLLVKEALGGEKREGS